MVSLKPVQKSKRRPGGPSLVLRRDETETQYYDKDEAWLAYSGAIKTGIENKKKPAPKLLCEVLQEFLSEHKGLYAKSTINGFKYHGSFLTDAFGDWALTSITAGDARKLYENLLTYSSPAVAPNALNLLSRLLYYGVEHGYLKREAYFEPPRPPLPPISSARRPPADAIPQMPGLTHIKIMLTSNSGLASIFAKLGLLEGLRCGESLGLDWDAIDWKNDEIDIRQSFGAHGDGELKVLNANRILPLLKPAAAQLRELHHSLGCPARGPVFLNARGERMRYESMVSRYYHWQCSLGIGTSLPYRLDSTGCLKWQFEHVWPTHALRHAAAALMIQAGMPETAVQKWLGHEHLSETLETYAYFFDLLEAGFTDLFADLENYYA